MIRVENLSKSYGRHEAVRGLSFHVPKGQVCGFLGPNGAGKSTTLRMLTGFLSPSSGTIRIGGLDALQDSIGARRQIGYMPEACPLYPEMRVNEYLRYRAELKGVRGADKAERVERALEQADVKDVEHRIIGQLSKGYRQRVGLADALVSDPPLLILDEPTAGLDPNQIRQVRTLIRRLAEDKTVLLSTHILPEVEAICDHVLILHKGKMVGEGKPGELRLGVTRKQKIRFEGRAPAAGEPGYREQPGAPDLEAFRRALAPIESVRVVRLDARGGLVRGRLEAEGDPDAVEKVFSAIVAAGLILRELRPSDASLEDVFADLTTAEADGGGDEEE